MKRESHEFYSWECQYTSNQITAEQATDNSRQPIVILITDGVPTISYETATMGYTFLDEDVQGVSVLDGAGGFRSIADVRASGVPYSAITRYAGAPVADVMQATLALLAAHPDATMHGIAVQASGSGIFNDEVVQYVASVGGANSLTPARPTRSARRSPTPCRQAPAVTSHRNLPNVPSTGPGSARAATRAALLCWERDPSQQGARA